MTRSVPVSDRRACRRFHAWQPTGPHRTRSSSSMASGSPPQLGGLEGVLRGEGLHGPAPGYPGFEVEVEALNADPTPMAGHGPRIVAHLEVVVGLDRPPILMGHSAGGVFTQTCSGPRLRRGAAWRSARRRPRACGRCRCRRSGDVPGPQEPGQPEQGGGYYVRALELRVHEHVPDGRAPALYERYHIPASGGSSRSSVLANIHPGPDNVGRTTTTRDRAPLLFISAGEDHLMPPSVQRSNAKHYKSGTVTEVVEFEGARTCCRRRRVGRRSPTTPSTGP